MRHHAFTLIELLVVIAIIGILAAMLIPLSTYLIWQVKAMRTEERILSLQRNVVMYGDAETFHQKLVRPGLLAAGISATGVAVFRTTIGQQTLLFGAGGGGGYLMPQTGDWIDPSVSWAFPHPWGPATYAQPTAATSAWSDAADQPPMDKNLTALSTLLNLRLLTAGGVIENDNEWLSDRSPNRAWNDAWGNPLVCAFALFQPPKNTTVSIGGLNLPIDIYVKQAKKAYGFDRALYLSISAAGDRLRTPLTGVAATDAEAVWLQATTTCQANQWDAAAWNHPPEGWSRPIRRGRQPVGGQLERSFISIPIEIR